MQATAQDASLSWPAQPNSVSAELIKVCAVLVDALMLLIPGLVIYAFYVGWSYETTGIYLPVTVALTTATVFAFYFTDLYRIGALLQPVSFLRRMLPVALFVLLAFIGFLFALKVSDRLSRVWVFTWFLASSSGLVLGRIMMSWVLAKVAKAGHLARRIVIVGGGDRGKQLIEHLRSRNDPLNHIVGVFDDRLERTDAEVSGVPMLGTVEDLLTYARHHRCDEVLVALPGHAHKRIVDVVNALRVLPVHVGLGPDFAGLNLLPTGYRDCGGVPVLSMSRKPFTPTQAMLKRAEDIILGGLITLLILPIMAIIAVLIKLDSRGPVLFRQPRYGFNNQLINVYKFRSMYADKSDHAGSQLTQKNDPRITRIGRFLRRSSLDELPQFFNVLKGEMSIVGPRPHAVQAKAGSKLYEDVVSEYAARHRVKPGITGWAQVNGWRGETNTDEQILQRVDHDLHYINNWSLPLDVWIILLTITTVLKGDKAM